jgi:hypothetical protein
VFHADGGMPLVPVSTVKSRLSKLVEVLVGGGKDLEEVPKNQRFSPNAGSAVAADGRPHQAQ